MISESGNSKAFSLYMNIWKVEVVHPIIAKWTIEAERFERESTNTDVDFLNQLARESQRAYQATAEDDHAIFELPQFSAKIAASHVQDRFLIL